MSQWVPRGRKEKKGSFKSLQLLGNGCFNFESLHARRGYYRGKLDFQIWQQGKKKVMPKNRGCLGDLISETSVLLCWEDMGPVQLVNICGCIMCNKFCSYNFSLARWPPFSPPFRPGEFNSAFVYKACLCSEAMYSFCFEAQNRFACRWSAWSNSSLKFYSRGTYEPPL